MRDVAVPVASRPFVALVAFLAAVVVSTPAPAAPAGRRTPAADAEMAGEWTVTDASRAVLNDLEAVADCHADPSVFCMSYSRVTVGVTWTSPYSGQGGTASVLPQNDEFAYFYFSDPKNPEVFVKVLGDNNPDFIQLFVGGTTDFEYTVTFTGCTKLVTFHKAPFVFTGTASANVIPNPSCARGTLYAVPVPVTSLNGLTGDVTVKGGTGITVTPSAGTVTITSTQTTLPPSGPAGGSLTGTYPNPGIGAGQVVKSFAELKDDIVFGVGTNMTYFVSHNPDTIVLDATGFPLPYVATLAGGLGSTALKIGNSNTTLGTGIMGIGGTASTVSLSLAGNVPVGLYGTASNGFGVFATSDNAVGVYGISTSGTGAFGFSINGIGIQGSTQSAGGYGVLGQVSAGTGNAGVKGLSTATNGSGVLGEADTGTLSYGIYGVSAAGFAGYFQGKVHATGGVSSTIFAAQIDHPVDPAGMTLTHSSVESPDMKTIYDGLVTTDANGEATVTLPAYFEALNGDFRYQLTVIGDFAQAIVARKIQGNRFVIRTSKPDLEVSWQVTGIRHDAFANAHRTPVEESKAVSERGFYMHPELFGEAPERSLEALRKHGSEGQAAAAAAGKRR